MRATSETALVSTFVWMVFAFGVSTAQFKILGLLEPEAGSDSLASAGPLVKISSFDENSGADNSAMVSSGQARGFSVEQLDKAAEKSLKKSDIESVKNVNVIKVRIIDELSSKQLEAAHDPAVLDNAITINTGLEADSAIYDTSEQSAANKPKSSK